MALSKAYAFQALVTLLTRMLETHAYLIQFSNGDLLSLVEQSQRHDIEVLPKHVGIFVVFGLFYSVNRTMKSCGRRTWGVYRW